MTLTHHHQIHEQYLGFLLHRLSGLLLALFIPAHLYVLALASQPDTLDTFLDLTMSDAMRFGEWGIVFLLTTHLVLGLRVIRLELLPWSSPHGALQRGIRYGLLCALLISLIFAARMFA